MPDDVTHDQLEVGHPARPAAAAALWTSLACAAGFTAFAYLTTQVHAVRSGSPWQEDPYDVVVTFTVFFVPLLGVLGALRAPLCRQALPLPRYRLAQLLRLALTVTLLVAATLATDWTAVALRADRGHWNHGTPWLVASLVPLTLVTGAGLLRCRRAVRLLPGRTAEGGDWLEDLAPLAALLTARLPRAGHALLAPVDLGGALALVRRRFTLLAAAGALGAGLLVATGLASGEGWPGGLLFTVETAVFASGTFAFAMTCNAVLRFAALPPASPTTRALRLAATTATALVPLALALRDPLWRALGFGAHVDSASLGRWALLTLAAAALTGGLAFAVAVRAAAAGAARE